MPVPKPKADEMMDNFMSRCMGDGTMNSEYPDKEQRAGVCSMAWKDTKKMTEVQEQQVYDMRDVEIFSIGKWNGAEYTEKDLDDMCTAQQEVGIKLKPYLKLGHDDDEKLLQKDGMPAAGWITNLKRVGGKLLADFKNVPRKIKELIDKKAYGRFSSEIYWNLDCEGKKYRRALKAVALLGGDTPAVSNLDDFINLYIDNKMNCEVKICNTKEDDMSEQLVKELTAKLEKFSADAIDQKAEILNYSIKLNDSENKIKELETKIAEKDKEVKVKEIKIYIDSKVTEGKVLPAQVERYTKLANADFDSFKALMEDMPKVVELGEKTHKDDDTKVKKYSEMETEEEKDVYLDTEAKKYSTEQKVGYKQALEFVMRRLQEEGV